MNNEIYVISNSLLVEIFLVLAFYAHPLSKLFFVVFFSLEVLIDRGLLFYSHFKKLSNIL